MATGLNRTIAANAVLFSGLSFTILGAGTLLSALAGGSRGGAFLASFAIVIGVLLAYVAVRIHKAARFIFGAAFLILSGIFLIILASGILNSSIRQLWPIFVIFAGVSLFPAGWFRYRSIQARFIIPMLAFLILGSVFFLFSLGLVPTSFKAFFLEWWPLLLILAGLILTLVSLGSRFPGEHGQ